MKQRRDLSKLETLAKELDDEIKRKEKLNEEKLKQLECIEVKLNKEIHTKQVILNRKKKVRGNRSQYFCFISYEYLSKMQKQLLKD